MPSERIIFWLHRLLLEKADATMYLQARIQVLSHQIQHFDSMDVRVKKEVLEDLVKDFEKMHWASSALEIRQELDKIEKAANL